MGRSRQWPWLAGTPGMLGSARCPGGSVPELVNGPGGAQVAETRVCSSRGAGVEVRGFSPGTSRILCCEMLGELVFERGAVSRRTSETKRGCI